MSIIIVGTKYIHTETNHLKLKRTGLGNNEKVQEIRKKCVIVQATYGQNQENPLIVFENIRVQSFQFQNL